MNTTIQAGATKTAASTLKTGIARPSAPSELTPEHEREALVKRPASEVTQLVFMALLGCAACLALVGVMSQAGEPGNSPDDPAPVVIIN